MAVLERENEKFLLEKGNGVGGIGEGAFETEGLKKIQSYLWFSW